MSNLRILFASISAIVLFLYGLEGFSREIQTVGGEALRKWLGHLTKSRWRAVVLGAVATAIIQSSSAVTSLTVALVDAGEKLPFRVTPVIPYLRPYSPTPRNLESATK